MRPKQSLATMKLLQGFHSEDAARELQLRMERAGIAILVTTPLKVRNTDTGFTHLVFAALPSQHADAMQLLHRPDHVVQHPVDLSDFKAHMSDPAQRQLAWHNLGKGLWLGVLALAAGVAVLAWALLQHG